VTAFDYIVLVILGASVLLGLVRGLVRELLSLLAYVLATLAAIWWGPWGMQWLAPHIENDLLRTIAAYGAIFFIVILLCGLLSLTVTSLIEKAGLGVADHGLGAVFGMLRGVAIVFVLVVLAGYTDLPQQDWWRDAALSNATVQGVKALAQQLPQPLAQLVPYPPSP